MELPDLYGIMGLTKDATKAEIKRAYRALAMKYHPDKHPEDRDSAEKKFIEITNCYKILIDDEDRKRYDSGALKNKKRHTPFYHSEIDDLYKRFYGDQDEKNNESSINTEKSFHDPFYSPSREYVAHHRMEPHSMPNKQRTMRQPMPQTEQIRRPNSPIYTKREESNEEDDYLPSLIGQITVNVYLTVEEMFNGCTKVYNVARCRDGIIEHKKCTITLFPGTPENTEIRAKGCGNKLRGRDPEDIVFIVRLIPHMKYQVDGLDIIENKTVVLKDALLGFTLNVTCLDGEKITRDLTGPIPDGAEIALPGKGLTDQKTKEKGNHVIHVCVEYPTHLTEEQRQAILSCFK